ncbi:metallophosphoesterase [Planctomycetota bacterium]|nr:metallophosphoesterase [Planctomycetota bacterium]
MSEDMNLRSYDPSQLLGNEIRFRDAEEMIGLFEKATAACRGQKGLKGSVIDVEAKNGARLVMTGDLHDNGENLLRILKYAKLDKRQNDVLILHEVVHGGNYMNDMDMSVRMLARVAWLKIQYGDRLIVLQSNHELAQRNGEGILKAGLDQIEAFDLGLDYLYGEEDAKRVREAIGKYIEGLPLAVRMGNGVMLSHSLPGPRKMKEFDPGILERGVTKADLEPKGNAHLMVWGRRHRDEQMAELGKAWGVHLFVMGHQNADMGYEEEGEMGVFLASNHEHGVLVPIEMDRVYDQQSLVEGIVRLAGIRLS